MNQEIKHESSSWWCHSAHLYYLCKFNYLYNLYTFLCVFSIQIKKASDYEQLWECIYIHSFSFEIMLNSHLPSPDTVAGVFALRKPTSCSEFDMCNNLQHLRLRLESDAHTLMTHTCIGWEIFHKNSSNHGCCFKHWPPDHTSIL